MNIGLVLSGGMAKGAYQIGVLRALNEFVPRQEVKYISCASVGVLNGYAYATDQLDHAEKLWLSLCNDDTRYLIGQMLRSSVLQQDIISLCREEKPLEATFYTTLLESRCRDLVYTDLAKVTPEEMPRYLKASVAMPVYNKAVQIGDVAYYDGAMVDNIPVYPLLAHELDYIICVYFDDTCYKFESAAVDSRILKITFPGDGVLKQSVSFTKDSLEKMIHDGYTQTKELLGSIFAGGYEDLEQVRAAIESRNKNSKNTSMRITGDVLVTNLNKIAKKLTKRKII